ncbi:hypothetical protein LLG96_19800 [bacterium]|nr:hypothetical protein [bacterium]
MHVTLWLAVCLLLTGAGTSAAGSDTIGPRRSVVTCHMSFDTTDFLADEFITQSGKMSLEKRRIDFPEGRFGKGIHLGFIPQMPDTDNMTGTDLDLTTAVIFDIAILPTWGSESYGFYEPFWWGEGRISPRLGAIAFWAKGKPPYACRLFEQASIAFGRKERDLIGIDIDKDLKISAYLRDARYVRHELAPGTVWDSERWNHVVLNWDWANGLELWLNGEKIASTWGGDGWFETLPPGLFHLAAPGLTYDELYLMDRPLSRSEIQNLVKSNRAPGDESTVYTRKQYDIGRIARVSGSDRSENLPVAAPDYGMTVTEVWPCDATDGHIPGWYVIDGRNEMAWPHEYAFFTIIPGDADFHAGKVDIPTPPGAAVNYVTVTGNLTDVTVQAGSPDREEKADLFTIPAGERFFYGSMITATEGAAFRIPFTIGYGCPPGFQGDAVHLPVSGDKRIHNVGLYHVGKQENSEPAGTVYTVLPMTGGLDSRYDFAFHALTARDERRIALASRSDVRGKRETVDIGAFRRLNIMSEPFTDPTGVTAVTLSIPLKTARDSEALYVRVHDPAVPSRLWNQFAVSLRGFPGGFRTLVLTIDFTDLVLTGGDRLWIDLGTAGGCDLALGDVKSPAHLYVATAAPYIAVDAYADKEIISAKAQYSKMYEFMPWKFTGRTVSLDHPDSYGGPFDMILPALAVKRVKPDHFTANFLDLLCGPKSRQFVIDGAPPDPALIELIRFPNPSGAPDWALYMHIYNTFRHSIADWWVKNQNPDGQVGGGWNDDTLFISFHQADLPLDGSESARAVIDTVHTKFELTGLFKDGYCRIHPIDRLHVGDFISERYNTVVNNLGQAYAAEREMESAWHSGHPERTPLNYGNGGAFKSSVNVLNWYWGKDVPTEPYVTEPLDKVTGDLHLFASTCTDFNFFRYTGSNIHRDDFRPYGADDAYRYLLGGSRGTRWDAHLKLAVMWPSGGGPEVARIILKADDTSLEAVCYSFDNRTRSLAMRLCRIQDGRYRIGLYRDPDGTGKAGEAIWKIEQQLSRFDVVTLPVPPHTPLVIRVEQIERVDRPAELPDLAVDTRDISRTESKVTVIVHNLGNSAAKNVLVRLLTGEETVAEQRIVQLDAPTDFIPKREVVTFPNVPKSRNLNVVVDPDNAIREILEENNSAGVR